MCGRRVCQGQVDGITCDEVDMRVAVECRVPGQAMINFREWAISGLQTEGQREVS